MKKISKIISALSIVLGVFCMISCKSNMVAETLETESLDNTKKIFRTINQNVNGMFISSTNENNPVLLFVNTISTNISEVLSSQKKQKIAKYRLNHVKYRLYQMEQIIESGNPYNLVEGKKLDRMQ